MTLPTWSATGSSSETSVSWPTHVAGDVGILAVSHGNFGTTITTPSGWTAFPGSPVDPGTTFNVCLSLFYRVATSNAEGAATIAGTVNYKFGVIITYAGVMSNHPIHGITSAFWSPAQSPIACPGISTLLNDCLIVYVISWSTDDAGPLGSAETNGSLSSINERFDGGTTTGGGGGLIIWDGQLSTLGTIGPATVTTSTNNLAAIMVFALTPADKTLPTLGRKSRAVNTGSM